MCTFMKIKRVEIIGFKSFVDKVSLDFQQGITAIVGPNGCGKSNIVDAIRWVMGEQSAKNLRGSSMEDIIFIGSQLRKPVGMAEVSIIFSTEDGRVPAKYLNFHEIQVTRRIYRDGESEYFLNKTPCRLLDITELFMDTGVGAKAYSIIEQGKIGMILHAKPEERRFIIEEAAGISKFKARKKVALRKIEVTRQNLLRIGDIGAEIKRQLNGLQRQAKKAEKFREYREELKEIELTFAVRQYLASDETRMELEGALAGLKSRVAALAGELESAELSLEEKRIVLLEEEKSLTVAQEEIYRSKADLQGFENRLEFQKKELANLERQKVRFEEEQASLERQLAEAQAERKGLEEHGSQFVREMAEEEDQLQFNEQELEELVVAEAELARKLEETRRALFALLSEIAQASNQLAVAAKKLEAMEERAERNRREALTLGEKQAETSRVVAELEGALSLLAGRKGELVEELAQLQSRESELKASLVEQDKELQARREELSSKSSRLHSLQELEAQFAGYGQGVRSLFLSERFKGRFKGVIADIVETGEQYEAALEASLSDRLQSVIGAGEDDALEAIGYLRDNAGGRGSFVLKGVGGAASSSAPPGGVKIVDKLQVATGYQELVGVLLADTFLVDDLAAALSLARQFPALTFVTMGGELVAPGGIVSGGSMEGADQGLVHKKREIKELAQATLLLSTQVREQEAGRDQLKLDIAAAEESAKELRQMLHQKDLKLVNADKDLQRAREERQRIEERFRINELDEDQLREERDLLLAEMDNSSGHRTVGEEKKQGLESEVDALQQSLTVKKEELGVLRERVTTMKVRSAALKERRESTLRALKRVDDLVKDLLARIDGRRTELMTGEEERERLAVEVSRSDEGLKQLLARQLGAETAHNVIRDRYEAQAILVREEDARLKGLRGLHEQARQEVAEKSLQLAEISIGLQHLQNSLLEKYRVDIAALVPGTLEHEFAEEENRRRQVELQKLVEELGEVNLMAVDEYNQLEERFNFLTTQQIDLQESLDSLLQAIQRINKTTRKRFEETFQLVNAKFQEVFPRLFCGGVASLKMTNEDDLLETGIEIVAQPPGKKLQNITALSGGEKALTAVALIFAIFMIKPSPFCLLDEVDAPLDDANIGRFNEMVREMSATSQFITITHNKTTMAIADILYGVTMEEPGVSKLVSVKLH